MGWNLCSRFARPFCASIESNNSLKKILEGNTREKRASIRRYKKFYHSYVTGSDGKTVRHFDFNLANYSALAVADKIWALIGQARRDEFGWVVLHKILGSLGSPVLYARYAHLYFKRASLAHFVPE